VKEIIDGYKSAQEFAEYARYAYGKEYILSEKMNSILNSLSGKPLSTERELSQEDRVAFDALSQRLWSAHRNLCNLTASYDRQSRAYDTLQKEHEKFVTALEGVFNSISWKITTPLRRINKGFRSKDNK